MERISNINHQRNEKQTHNNSDVQELVMVFAACFNFKLQTMKLSMKTGCMLGGTDILQTFLCSLRCDRGLRWVCG